MRADQICGGVSFDERFVFKWLFYLKLRLMVDLEMGWVTGVSSTNSGHFYLGLGSKCQEN